MKDALALVVAAVIFLAWTAAWFALPLSLAFWLLGC